MNIEKIFSALDTDDMSSALGSICAELEKQGYEILINNIEVTSEEFFNNRLESLEQSSQDFNFTLRKGNSIEQKFGLKFTNYHEIIFKKTDPKLDIHI